MCGGGLASSNVHVKFTTMSAHTLLFEVVMFTFKVTFSGLSTQKESTIRKKFLLLFLFLFLFCFFFFWGGGGSTFRSFSFYPF